MRITAATGILIGATLTASVAVAQAVAPAPAAKQQAATTAPAAPSAEDSALLEKHCSSCHAIDDVTTKSKDATAWAETIDRMVGYGAQLETGDRDRIQKFLIAHNGPKAK